MKPLTCCFKNTKYLKNSNIFKEYFNYFEEDIDIINIISKLHDIEEVVFEVEQNKNKIAELG